MPLKDVFAIRESNVIDLAKARSYKKATGKAVHPFDVKKSFEDHAANSLFFQDVLTPQEKIQFYRLYLKKHGKELINTEDWAALHDEFENAMSKNENGV